MDPWAEAQRLERAGQVSEAIDMLRTQTGGSAAHWQAQASNLLERRAHRLWRAGDVEGARVAARGAVEWLREYASYASGSGEGLMVMADVERLEKRLQKIASGRPSTTDRLVQAALALWDRMAAGRREK